MGGIQNMSSSLRETALMVRAVATQHGARRIITLGSSMGGFGALLVGALVDAEEAIAIAPQTNLTPAWRSEHGDTRWGWKMDEMESIGYRPRDLKPILAATQMRSRIFLDASVEIDVTHAKHVENHAEIIDIGHGGHVCAGYMHESGLAAQVLREALNRQVVGEAAPDRAVAS